MAAGLVGGEWAGLLLAARLWSDRPKLARKFIFTAVCVAGPLFLDRMSVQRDWG